MYPYMLSFTMLFNFFLGWKIFQPEIMVNIITTSLVHAYQFPGRKLFLVGIFGSDNISIYPVVLFLLFISARLVLPTVRPLSASTVRRTIQHAVFIVPACRRDYTYVFFFMSRGYVLHNMYYDNYSKTPCVHIIRTAAMSEGSNKSLKRSDRCFYTYINILLENRKAPLL